MLACGPSRLPRRSSQSHTPPPAIGNASSAARAVHPARRAHPHLLRAESMFSSVHTRSFIAESSLNVTDNIPDGHRARGPAAAVQDVEAFSLRSRGAAGHAAPTAPFWMGVFNTVASWRGRAVSPSPGRTKTATNAARAVRPAHRAHRRPCRVKRVLSSTRTRSWIAHSLPTAVEKIPGDRQERQRRKASRIRLAFARQAAPVRQRAQNRGRDRAARQAPGELALENGGAERASSGERRAASTNRPCRQEKRAVEESGGCERRRASDTGRINSARPGRDSVYSKSPSGPVAAQARPRGGLWCKVHRAGTIASSG